MFDAGQAVISNGRTDDGSDQTIVSSQFVESAVLQNFERFTNIEKVCLQAALKDTEIAQKFSFSGTWTPPRTILHLNAGPLALLNASFLVADDKLSVEDMLIGLRS